MHDQCDPKGAYEWLDGVRKLVCIAAVTGMMLAVGGVVVAILTSLGR